MSPSFGDVAADPSSRRSSSWLRLASRRRRLDGGSSGHGGGAWPLTDGGEPLFLTPRAFLSFGWAGRLELLDQVDEPEQPLEPNDRAFCRYGCIVVGRSSTPFASSNRLWGGLPPRVRHPEQADRWSWLVLVAYTQLRLMRPCVADRRLPWERRYTPGYLTPVRVRRGVFGAFGRIGHAHQATKTLRTLPGAAQRTALGPGEALPGHQEGRLSSSEQPPRSFCDVLLPSRKTPHG